MKKNAVIMVALSCLFLFVPQDVFGCICGVIGPKPTKPQFQNIVIRQYNKATAIFTGEVLSVGKFYVVLKVNQTWKGEKADRIEISTGARYVDKDRLVVTSSSCDFRFSRKIDKLLVFAYKTKYDDLQIMHCSLSNSVGRAKRTIKALNRLKNIENIK